MKTLLGVVAFAAALLLVAREQSVLPIYILYFCMPVVVAVVIVFLRRHNPAESLVTGAAITLVLLAVLSFPFIAINAATGVYDTASDPSCDGFCMSTTGGVIFALTIWFFIAVPIAIVGGVVSAIAASIGRLAFRPA